MRASVCLSMLEQEAGFPEAKERGRKRMETLKAGVRLVMRHSAFVSDFARGGAGAEVGGGEGFEAEG